MIALPDDRGAPAASVSEEFPPTLREVMLRPRWISTLLLCLIAAGVFAWLGQWQLARAIDTDPPAPGATEQIMPLTDVIGPGQYLPEASGGQRVETAGTWVPEDFIVISGRFNGGVEGFWVTGQLRVADRTSVAVAVGWASTREQADAAVAALTDAGAAEAAITGRLIDDEGVELPHRTDPDELTRMSPAALLSRWHDTEQLDVLPALLGLDHGTGRTHRHRLSRSCREVDGELAQHFLCGRMGDLRRVRLLPVVPPGQRRLGAPARGDRGPSKRGSSGT